MQLGHCNGTSFLGQTLHTSYEIGIDQGMGPWFKGVLKTGSTVFQRDRLSKETCHFIHQDSLNAEITPSI